MSRIRVKVPFPRVATVDGFGGFLVRPVTLDCGDLATGSLQFETLNS